jgi:gentisate 1,2-dioxygenase
MSVTANSSAISPVQLKAEDRPDQPQVTPELVEFYEGLERALLVPLWTEIGGLMPAAHSVGLA